MTRASTDLTGKASPLRFYAPRMRGGRARCADQLPLAASRIAGRSFSGVPNNPHARRQVNGHSRKRVRRIRIPRARERPVTSSNTASPIRRLMPGHAPSRSLARCSATSARSHRGLARRKGPSLMRSPGGAPGVLVLRNAQYHWSTDVSKASFSSPYADVPALGLSLANWL
jgi:hypothetical protein